MAGTAEIMFRSLSSANKFILRRNVNGDLFCKDKLNVYLHSRFCSSTATTKDDPAPVFFDSQVQTVLKLLTRPDPKRVFRRRMDSRPLTAPVYKFMTDEMLQRTMAKAEERMNYLLQMPPVLKEKPDDPELLSDDPEIRNHDDSNFVFTDISYGVKNKDRLVVVRETNGRLRMANNEERKRMIQVYFPSEGREIFPPQIFFGEHLQNLLDRHEYEYILNRAVIQYDPNESEWFRITHTVYDHINKEKTFDKLLSTRFYGPMVFYFTWNKNIENLLLEYLKAYKIEDAARLVKLYHLIHPDCISAKTACDEIGLEYIGQFIKNEAKNKEQLETALNRCIEWQKAQIQLEENVKKAHGVE